MKRCALFSLNWISIYFRFGRRNKEFLSLTDAQTESTERSSGQRERDCGQVGSKSLRPELPVRFDPQCLRIPHRPRILLRPGGERCWWVFYSMANGQCGGKARVFNHRKNCYGRLAFYFWAPCFLKTSQEGLSWCCLNGSKYMGGIMKVLGLLEKNMVSQKFGIKILGFSNVKKIIEAKAWTTVSREIVGI